MAFAFAPDFGEDDVFREAEGAEDADDEPGGVEFPPAVAVGGGALVGVVVVMPAFAKGHDADEPVIATAVARVVVAVAPQVRPGIDGPGAVPVDDGPHENAPDE